LIRQARDIEQKGGRVETRELSAFSRELVKMWSFLLRRSERTDISIAQIIDKDQDDIGCDNLRIRSRRNLAKKRYKDDAGVN